VHKNKKKKRGGEKRQRKKERERERERERKRNTCEKIGGGREGERGGKWLEGNGGEGKGEKRKSP